MRTSIYKIIITLFLLSNTGLLLASDHGEQVKDIIYAKSVNLYTIPQAGQPDILSGRQEAPQGIPPHNEEINQLKNQTLPVYDATNKIFHKMDMTNNLIAPVNIWSSMMGPVQSSLTPADVDIGSGAFHKTIVVSNPQFSIYDSLAHQNYTNTFANFFSSLGVEALMFDPKVIYDVHNSRWVMVILGVSNDKTRSYTYLGISKTNDANGDWWTYKSDMRYDGSTQSTNWADLPCVGFSTDNSNNSAIIIGTNQYTISNSVFQYSKMRLFKTAQIYSGLAATTNDFWNFSDVGGSAAFTPSPARQLSKTTSGQIFILSTKNAGGSVINIRSIFNPSSNTPTMGGPAEIQVTPYSVPSSAPSLGGNDTILTGDCRTRDVYFLERTYENGCLYTAFATSVNWGSGNNGAIQYECINTFGNNIMYQFITGGNNLWAMYPCAAPEYRRNNGGQYADGNAGIGFSLTSGSMYPSYCVLGTNDTTNTAYSIINGTGYLGSGSQRFGDYSGIAPDPSGNGQFHAAGMIARAGLWGTGVFDFAFTRIPVSGVITYSDNGEKVSQGKVYALHYDAATATIVLRDSVSIEPSNPPSGFYSLQINPADSCYILFWPDITSSNFVPSFYKSNGQPTLDWRLATQVQPALGLNYNNNVQVIRLPFATGSYSISGTASANTGLDVTTSPLNYAVVYSQIGSNYKSFGMSASNGNYTIPGLAAGNYILNSHRIGYNPQTQNVVITNSNLTNINFNFGNPIGIERISSEVPSAYSLNQNYPNPFNPVTQITYGLPKSGNVKLAVYDILGREVAVIINGHQDAGKYKFDFNASALSSGIYFYQLTANSFTETKKMVVTK